MDTYNVTAGELRHFIEMYEDLQARKDGIAGEQRDLIAEAKGRGYSGPIIREIVKLRRMKPDDRAEREAVLEMYMSALGMS